MGNNIVYLRFERNNEVRFRDINIGLVADVFSTDSALENKVKALRLLKINPDRKRERRVFSCLDVIRQISEELPGTDVENVGEEEFIIDFIDENKSFFMSKAVKYVNLVLICAMTFAGSSFSIIAYDNDVDINGVFKSINKFFGVNENKTFTQIMYSIGFALGMIVFYNHFCGKKIMSDPTPIEVEESAYEKEIDEALFDEDKKRKEIIKRENHFSRDC